MAVEELSELEASERELVFDAFDFNDAFVLGGMLYETGLRSGSAFAVRIVLDGTVVFQALTPGAGAANVNWLERKCATVERSGHCSLWSFVQREQRGVTHAWQEDEAAYALYGGAFPLVAGGALAGVAAVSGLPHRQDHETLVQVVRAFVRSVRWIEKPCKTTV